MKLLNNLRFSGSLILAGITGFVTAVCFSGEQAKAAIRTYSFSNLGYSYTAIGGGNNCTAGGSCAGTMSGYFVWDNSSSSEGNGSLTLTNNPVARAGNSDCASNRNDCNGTRTYNRWAVGSSNTALYFWDSTGYDIIRLDLVTGLSGTDQRYVSFSGASATDGFASGGSTNANGTPPSFTLTTAITLNGGNNFNVAPSPALVFGLLPFLMVLPRRRMRARQKPEMLSPENAY